MYDVVVIGAGPAGITAAIYLKRANLNVAILEKDAPGGLMNKTAFIENYPGEVKIGGADLALKFFAQLTALEVPYLYGEAKEVINNDDHKVIVTANEEIKTKRIVLAIGRRPRTLKDKNAEGLEGRGISFCAICDANLYKGEDVAIVGGGNSALEEALYLSEICNKVYIIHRSNELRGDKTLVPKVLGKENIELIYFSEIDKFVAEDGKLASIDLLVHGEKENIKVKACFVFIGYEPATEFLKNLDILDEKGYIIVNDKGETPVKGIYAAGDAIRKDVYQIVTATGEGAICAVSITKDLA